MGNPQALALQAGGPIRGWALPASQAQTPPELRPHRHKTAGELSQRAPLSPLRRLTWGKPRSSRMLRRKWELYPLLAQGDARVVLPRLRPAYRSFMIFFFLVCCRPVQPLLKPVPCAEPPAASVGRAARVPSPRACPRGWLPAGSRRLCLAPGAFGYVCFPPIFLTSVIMKTSSVNLRRASPLPLPAG